MEAFFAHWHRRLGSRYVPVLMAATVLGAVAMAATTVGAGARYAEADLGAFANVLAVMTTHMVIAMAFGAFATRDDVRRIVSWTSAGEPTAGAADVWLAALRLPGRVMSRLSVVIALGGIPVAIYAGSQFDVGAGAWVALYAGGMIALAAGVTWVLFAGEIALRPIVTAAVRAGVDEPPAPPRRLPLRVRALCALLSVTVFAAALVGALVTAFDDPAVRLVAALGIAIFVTLSIGLVHMVAITGSILNPVEQIAAATRRIAAGDYSGVVPVLTEDEMGELTRSFNRMVDGLREREALHAALGRYADPEVARRVLDDPDALAGEEVEVTVMFVDIRDFTATTGAAAPREAVSWLNEFFEVVIPVLREHGGHPNKFMGDGVLGVFGVPDHHLDHADRALAAARDVAARVAEAFGAELGIGIGVNTGRVLAGTVGGGGKLEFAVIGDAVNVAARVEELTKDTGDCVLCTEATRRALSDDGALVSRGKRVLRGKTEPTPLYALSL